jgi:hypothetical protein
VFDKAFHHVPSSICPSILFRYDSLHSAHRIPCCKSVIHSSPTPTHSKVQELVVDSMDMPITSSLTILFLIPSLILFSYFVFFITITESIASSSSQLITQHQLHHVSPNHQLILRQQPNCSAPRSTPSSKMFVHFAGLARSQIPPVRISS